ncbi:MAG: chemotaxis-specific protein-glutamate methyltransferase CheB [Mariprofundaceae bacterium]
MPVKKRVLIVDDSVVFRSFFRGCLSEIDQVEVVGIARDGRDALKKVKELKPDLVTLDMEMPHLSGIEVLRALQKDAPSVSVLVLSAEVETDAKRTVEALEAGAFDFIIKPTSSATDPKSLLQKMIKDRLRVLRSIAQVVGLKAALPAKSQSVGTKPVVFRGKVLKPDVVAIGSSTGGPVALHRVLHALPASFPVPITVTQHMPKLFLGSLAQRLETDTALECKLAEDGMILKAGCIYVAPGEVHMSIERVGTQLKASLKEGPRVHHCIPAVDVTFKSLVELAPRVRTLAVVLTGMGADGAEAAKLLADKNAHVIAQDEESSVVWGMPGETVRLGAAHEVLPLDDIAGALIQHCGAGRKP